MQLGRMRSALAAFLCCISSCTSRLERDAHATVDTRVDLGWNDSHSSDVALVRIQTRTRRCVEASKCELDVARVVSIEPFKGPRVADEEVEVWGIGAHDLAEPGTEHLLFLRMYPLDSKVSDVPYSACTRSAFEKYLQVHDGCCAAVRQGPGSTSRDLLLYDMLTSEERGPTYRVSAEPIFRELRNSYAVDRGDNAI